MNDFWTASVTPGGRGPSNETWQNGDICRNIGYSLHPLHLALSLSVSHPLPLARLTRPDCLRPLKHLFQLALPSWPGVLNLACVISILLLIKKRKKETKPCRHGSGKGEKALYKTEIWQTLNWIVRVCEGESYEAGGENSSKWNREIERERETAAVHFFSYLTSTTQGKKPISHQPADMNDEFCCLKPILHRDRIVGGTLDLL